MEDKTTTRNEDIQRGGCSSGIGALMNAFRYAFVILITFISGAVVWYFTFEGYFTVSPQESVILMRFGKIQSVYTEGWHWSFPAPVSRIVRIPTSRQTISLRAFWPNPVTSPGTDMSLESMSAPIVPGRDGSLLTGDANIIHTEWELVYEISDPLKYFTTCMTPLDPKRDDDVVYNGDTSLGTRGPRTLIKNLLQDAIIKVTAVQNVDAPLYKEVSAYQDSARDKTIEMVDAMDIGVTVRSLVLKDKTPPYSTVSAFYDVINAEQESSKEKLSAQDYAVTVENAATAESSRIVVEAEVYRKRVVSEIQSESIYFGKILEGYRLNPESVLIPLYFDTVTAMLENVKDKYILPYSPGDTNHQEIRIMLNPEPSYNKKAEEAN